MTKNLDRPGLSYVPQTEAIATEGNGVKWTTGVSSEMIDHPAFEYGTATLEPGAEATVTPGTSLAERDHECAALVTDGEAAVTAGSERHRLGVFDCLFVPPGAEYSIQNPTDVPLEYIWGVAERTDDNQLLDADRFDHGGLAQVVHTLRDVDVSVTLESGHCSRVWSAVFPETVGSCDLTMGFITRPPGSVATLHEHDPSFLTEAFTVIDGQLLITDHDGTDTVLSPGEFMYIPERGVHRNKSIHPDGTTYAFIENPARSREMSPFSDPSVADS